MADPITISNFRFNRFFKVISATVAGIFLYNQIAYAGDFAALVLERQEEAQAQAFAPDYLRGQQAMRKSMVLTKQAIEDDSSFNAQKLASPIKREEASVDLIKPRGGGDPSVNLNPLAALNALNFLNPDDLSGDIDPTWQSVITTENDTVYYSDGRIERVDRHDGVAIRNIVLNDSNELIKAVIEYADNTIQYIEVEDGHTCVTVTRPDGSILRYTDNILESIEFIDGNRLTYNIGGDGTILERTYDTSGVLRKRAFYDRNGLLSKIEFADGSRAIYYEEGRLSCVELADGIIYYYTAEEIGGDMVVSLSRILDSLGIKFGLEDSEIVSVEHIDWDGMRKEYDIVASFEPNKANRVSPGNIDGNGIDDTIVDFGEGYGIYILFDSIAWIKLHDLSPESITIADLDNNGQDDIVLDFGQHGLYIWNNNSYWNGLHELSAGSIARADIDGTGADELVVDFGEFGIWIWHDNSYWTPLHTLSSEGLSSGDIDGNGIDDIIVDFGQYGLWVWQNNTEWRNLSPVDPDFAVSADIDGNGRDDVVADFGQYGLYVFHDNGVWEQVIDIDPESVTVADLDSNGMDELVADFGVYGLFIRYNNAEWAGLHTLSPLSVITRQSAESPDDLIIDFGAPYGIWSYNTSSGWLQVHPYSPGSTFSEMDPVDGFKIVTYIEESRAQDFKNQIGLPAIPDITSIRYDDSLIVCPVGGSVISLDLDWADREALSDEAALNAYFADVIAQFTTTEEISSTFRVATTRFGETATYKMIGENFRFNTRLSADGTFTSYTYDETGSLTGFTKTFIDGVIEIFDNAGRITEKRVPDRDFKKGVNLAWQDYGYDLDKVRTAQGYSGYASDMARLYELLEKNQNSYVRLFLFCDLRSSIVFNSQTGMPESFSDKVYENMDALLKAAETFNIKLIPTLFDYTLADEITDENGYKVGEHPEVITDPDKRRALLALFDDFFVRYGSDSSVYAWDIMNEPEYAAAVSIQDARSFVSDFASLIHSKAPGALVTVGSKDRQSLVQYWRNTGLDLYQYHYYDDFEPGITLDYSASDLGLDKPVLAGELEPTSLSGKLDTVYDNGYAGGFFWNDGGDYVIDEAKRAEIRDWFKGGIITYDYYASGRLHTVTLEDGTVREYEDACVYADGNGRLLREDFVNGTRKIYEYYGASSVLNNIRFTLSGLQVLLKESYDIYGDFLSSEEYYDEGSLKEIHRADGAWTRYGEDGRIAEICVNEDGVRIEKDKDGNVTSRTLADGTIYEYAGGATGDPTRMVKPDNTVIEYFYDGEGILSHSIEYYIDGDIASLDKDNNIIWAYDYTSGEADGEAGLSLVTALGDTITYAGDQISEIALKDANATITDIELDAGGSLLNGIIIRSDGSRDIIYLGMLVETILRDGTLLRYRDGRKAAEYSKGLGITRYSYELDVNGEILRTKTVNGSAISLYDADGYPIRFRKSNGEISEYENGHLTRLITQGCKVYLYNYVDDEDPRSELVLRGGDDPIIPVTIHYGGDNRKDITTVELYNGVHLDYKDGGLDAIRGLADGISISAEGEFAFLDGGLRKYFGVNGNLESVETDDGTTIYFEGDEITEIKSKDGSRMLYQGGRMSDLFDEKEGAHYETDADGRPVKVTYDSGAVFTYEYTTPSEGVTEVLIKDKDGATVSERRYEGDLLVWQKSSSGIVSVYTYEPDGEKRLKTVRQTKNGEEIGSFDYEYSGGMISVTDNITQDRREYDQNGTLKYRYTKDGYVFEYNLTENETLVMELIRWDKTDGRIIYYRNGEVWKVTCPVAGGNVTLLDPVFDKYGKLKSFTTILPTNESRLVTLYDNGWSEIIASGGVKLIYKGSILMAVNAGHRLLVFNDSDKIPSTITVDITEDAGALNHIELVNGGRTDYDKQFLYNYYKINKLYLPIQNHTVPGNIDWKTSDSYSSVTMGGDVAILSTSINGTSDATRHGEAYLDLRWNPDWTKRAHYYDLNNGRISFYVKLQDGSLTPGTKLTLQAFAKDVGDGENGCDTLWGSEYSFEVTITEDGVWYKVDMIISDITPFRGLKDSYFDPTQIALLGVRLTCDQYEYSYSGNIYIKDANYQTIPSGEEVVDFPFLVDINSVRPFVGAIPEFQPIQNPNYISWADIPTLFVDENNEDTGAPLDLDAGSWRAQEYLYSQGVESVTRDEANNQWVLGLDLKAKDPNKNDGEMFVDLAYDIPGYIWTGPIDLNQRELKFKVKAPAGFLASTSQPMWVQLFVKDVNGKHQYGRHVKIEAEGEWIEVTLVPQFGEIEEGNSETSPGFDPTRIEQIGLKISCNKDGVGQYQGEFFVQNATSPDVLDQRVGVDMIDANALRDYARKNDIMITFEEILGPVINMAKTSLPEYFKTEDYEMATEYYPTGEAKRVLKGNGRIEYYNIEGHLLKITDNDDTTLVAYKYDNDGELLEIDYYGVRNSVVESMNDARSRSNQQADTTIKEIGDAKFAADNWVRDTYQPRINEAESMLSNLRSEWRSWDDTEVRWWQWGKKEEKKQNMRALESAIGTLETAIANLYSSMADAYAQINTDINKAKSDIDDELEDKLDAIDAQETDTLVKILEQEITETIDVYYRKTLGRNVSEDEIAYWLGVARANGCINPDNRIAFDVSLVKDELSTKAEYVTEAQANDSFIQNVTEAVTQYLRDFTALSDEEKTQKLSDDLGLSGSDINYDPADFEAIIKWLSSNNKHFGRSAFLSLKALFDNNNLTVDLEDLAKKCILIDIFGGSITSITRDEMQISMFALSKYAELNSLTLYNTQLDNSSIDSLRDAVADSKSAIIRVEGNHFIVVESIDENGTVNYIETTKGSSGETMTMSEEDILKSWDGYAVSQRGPPEDGKSRLLTSLEAKKIRGSDIFAFFAIVSIICSIISAALSLIDNEIAQMLATVFAIVATVTGILNIVVNFDTIIRNFTNGLIEVTKDLGEKTWSLGNFFKQGVEGFAKATYDLLSRSVIGISLNMSYNKALTTFGLNSDVAQVISAFLSGGFVSMDETFSLLGGLTSLTVEGVRYAGRKLDIDPFITDIIGTTAGTMVSAGLGGVSYYDSYGTRVTVKGLEAIAYATKTVILPNVASQFAYYGINKLGELIGIDDAISQVVGIGIRTTVNAIWQGGDFKTVFDAAVRGLQQGIVSVGLNYATQALGLNPLLANLGFSMIASAINAGLRMAIGEGKDPFGTLFKTYSDNVLAFLSYNPTPNVDDFKDKSGRINYDAYNRAWSNYHWLEAGYKANILNFSEIVQTKGLIEALNTYATGFFNSTAITLIVSSGKTIGDYFAQKLAAGEGTRHTTPQGKEYISVEVPDGSGGTALKAFFEELTDGGGNIYYNLIGKEERTSDGGLFFGIGSIGKDQYARIGFTDGELTTGYDTYTQYQTIYDGVFSFGQLKDIFGTPLLEESSIYFDSYGRIVDGILKDLLKEYTYSFDYDNYAVDTLTRETNILVSDEMRSILQNFGVDPDDLGTIFYFIQNPESLLSAVRLDFLFGDELKRLFDDHPYLFGKIIVDAITNERFDSSLLNGALAEKAFELYKELGKDLRSMDMNYYPDRDTFVTDTLAKFFNIPFFEDIFDTAMARFKQETDVNNSGSLPIQGRIIANSYETTSQNLFGRYTLTVEEGYKYSEDKDAVLWGTPDNSLGSSLSGELIINQDARMLGSFSFDSMARIPGTVVEGGFSTELSGEFDKVIEAQKLMRKGITPAGLPLDINSGTKTSTNLLGSIHDSFAFVTNHGEIGFKIGYTTNLGIYAEAEIKFTPSEYARQHREEASERDKSLLLIEDIINGSVETVSEPELTMLQTFMNDFADELIAYKPELFNNDIKGSLGNVLDSLSNLNTPIPDMSYNDFGSLDLDTILDYTTKGVYDEYILELLKSLQ